MLEAHPTNPPRHSGGGRRRSSQKPALPPLLPLRSRGVPWGEGDGRSAIYSLFSTFYSLLSTLTSTLISTLLSTLPFTLPLLYLLLPLFYFYSYSTPTFSRHISSRSILATRVWRCIAARCKSISVKVLERTPLHERDSANILCASLCELCESRAQSTQSALEGVVCVAAQHAPCRR